jgi:predicted aspartyl protease
MGSFTVGCLLKNHIDREKAVKIPRLMVDTGSEATWIARRQLDQIEVKPEKRQTFTMANGQQVYRDVGYAMIRVSDSETVDEVVFAEPGDLILLGARALEGLRLWIDAHGKRLVDSGPQPVAKVIVPGPVPPDKDQYPPWTGAIIQGQGGPPPIAGQEEATQRGPKKKRTRL